MTNRERVIETVNFRKTDYLPHNIFFTSQSYAKVSAAYGDDYDRRINNHITRFKLRKPKESVGHELVRDEFGVVFNLSGADKDIGFVDFYQIRSKDDVGKYVFPPVDKNYLSERANELMATTPTNFRGFEMGFSLFERLWSLMGMEEALLNMIAEPELIHDIMKSICARNMEVLDTVLPYDFDFLLFGDDWGQQRGLIMGPHCWREFIKPYLKQMYEKVRDSGKYVMQHSCGDNRLIMDDLYETGLNVYQTYQPEIYGLDYADTLRGKIAVWGAISTQRDLPGKTPDELRAIIRETLGRFKETGGLIAAPTHDIPSDVPVENIAAMADEFMNQGG